MVNSHPIFEDVRPLNPNTIFVAGRICEHSGELFYCNFYTKGMHLKPPNPLEGELKHFLDNAKEGAILISLGTVRYRIIKLHRTRQYWPIFIYYN